MTTDAVLDARPPAPGPPASRTARLLLVDDQPIVRLGLRQLLGTDPDLVVVGEAATPRDALVIAGRCPPDLVVLDVDLRRGDGAGVELAAALLERHRGIKVLVLTGCRDRELMRRAIRAGVHGYLRKTAGTADIRAAVHALLRGDAVFDAHAGGLVLEVLPDGERPPRGLGGAVLTGREDQVLRLLAVGMSNREIARRLAISEATVKFHVRNLRDKLEVRRRTEIVHTATRQGIV